jgi:hypothetical protein
MAMAKRLKEPAYLPELGPEIYLWHTLRDVGLMVQTPMGQTPIGWPELNAFSQLTQQQLEPWEASTLIRMSEAYLAELSIGEEPFAMPPHERVEDEDPTAPEQTEPPDA